MRDLDAVISWVKQIFILSILSNIILHLMPSDKYEQYAKFICGIIIVVACMAPLISLLNGNTMFQDAYNAIITQQDIEDLKAELKYAEADSQDELIRTYEEKVESQAEEKALSYHLYPIATSAVIEDDPESEAYGTLQQINMKVSLSKEDEKEITIDDVAIGTITIGDSDQANQDANSQNIENSSVNELKDYLSNFYNLDLSNINISINGA